MAALNLTLNNFDSEVTNSDKPVLIDFWAPWCGPCQMVLPIIGELAEEITDTKICKVNVDENPELARRFQVMSIPTLILIKDGTVIKREVGAQSKAEILDMIR